MLKGIFMNKLGKLKGIRKCKNCGIDVEIYHKDRLQRINIFCSKKCEGQYIKSKTKLNCKCDVCGKYFHRKPSHITKTKHLTCSKKCNNELRKITYKGIGNPQYGLRGQLNASWKSDKRITSYGYVKIRKLEHPFKDCDGFVLEHRLVAEKYLLTDKNSITINGKRYLRPEYDVHHKDENKLNNSKDNLQIMTRSEHISYHSKKRKKNK